MKTPIQEVLETYEVMLSLHSEMAVSVRSVVEDLKSHLEKEKEFALNLWGQYEKECIIYNDYLGDHAYSIEAIEWYDQTFNTKEK